MGFFLIHMAKTAFCLALFYLFYKLLLSKDTFHRFNRVALLSLLLIAVTLPFIHLSLPQIPENELSIDVGQTAPIQESMVITTDLSESSPQNQPFPWAITLLSIYLTGFALFLGRFIWMQYRLYQIPSMGTSEVRVFCSCRIHYRHGFRPSRRQPIGATFYRTVQGCFKPGHTNFN
jgi:hypothetical protein